MKKSISKLNLNKMTITNLEASEMNAQIGGIIKTKPTISGLACSISICTTVSKSTIK